MHTPLLGPAGMPAVSQQDNDDAYMKKLQVRPE
jgi:hypothetical protein